MSTATSGIDSFAGRKYLAFDLAAWTPNQNVTKSGFGVPPNGPRWRLLGISFGALAAPSDVDGNLLIQVFNNDISDNPPGGTQDQLVVNFDAETMLNGSKMFAAQLIAESVENELTLEPGDYVTFRMDNNSVAIDTNPSIRCVVEYVVLPTAESLSTV